MTKLLSVILTIVMLVLPMAEVSVMAKPSVAGVADAVQEFQVFEQEAELQASLVTRDDGTWYFPVDKQYYQKFSDWCCCPGNDKCVLCNKYHPDWEDYPDPTLHSGQKGHNGIDLATPSGTPVYAAAAGKFYKDGSNSDPRGYYIVLEHPLGNGLSYYSGYQHLSKFNTSLSEGQSVNAGDLIGYTGGSGAGSGVHLHFGIVIGTSGKGLYGLNTYELWGSSNPWATKPEQTQGRIVNNPADNFPTGTAGATLEAIKAHAGSVHYTFDKTKVSIGPATLIEYATLTNGDYIFSNNGYYLNMAKTEGEDALNASQSASNKKFTVTKEDNFYIISAESGKYLNVWCSSSSTDGSRVGLYKNTKNDTVEGAGYRSQRWYFEECEGGYYIHPADVPSLYLTRDSSSNNIYVKSKATDTKYQVWKLEKADSGDAPSGDSTDLYPYSSAYKSSKYYTALKNVALSGDEATDLVNIALSQVGYHEGNSTSQLDGSNASGTNNYSEYGYWFGSQVNGNTNGHFYDWCAMFVSWCARHAGISTSTISNSAYAGASNEIYHFSNLSYFSRGNGTPKKGDLIFFDNPNVDGQWDHVGIVESVTSTQVMTIEGNASEQVKRKTYSLSDTYIQGYGRPNYKNVSVDDSTQWGNWSEWSETAVTASAYRKVETKIGYEYYHYILQYSDGNCGAYPINSTEFNKIFPNYPTTQKAYHTYYSDTELSISTKDKSLTYNNKKYDCYVNVHCPNDYNYDNGENASYLYYLGTKTMYRYCDAQFTITYNANGGTGAPANQTKTYALALALSTQKPTRSGYTFMGWGTTATGSVVYNPGSSYTQEKDITLYAIWQQEVNTSTYTVTYNANGGSNPPSAQTKTHGVNLALTTAKPTRTGFTFLGWSTTANGSVEYEAGAEYTVDGNVTLYAVWKKQDDEAKSIDMIVSSVEAKAGDEVEITISLEEHLGFNGLSFDVVYDSTKLDYLSYTQKMIFSGFVETSAPDRYENKVNFQILAGVQNVVATGELVTLKFKVLERAEHGNADVMIVPVDAFCLSSTDMEPETLVVNVKNGGVEISRLIPTNISLNKSFLSLEVGDTETLTATINPEDATNQNVTWTSSDETVATVEDGTVTAVGEGTATITVTTEDGGKTATCIVTVTKPEEEEPELPEEPDEDVKAFYTISEVTARAGDTVEVTVSLKTEEAFKAAGVASVSYDKNVLTFDKATIADDIKNVTFMQNFDKSNMTFVAAASEEIDGFEGKLFTLTFKINEEALAGEYGISGTASTTLDDAIKSFLYAGKVIVIDEIPGDVNLDDRVNSDDAVLLLQNILFPKLYPISYKGSVDFNGDGKVTTDDAIRLLQHAMFPSLYPIA